MQLFSRHRRNDEAQVARTWEGGGHRVLAQYRSGQKPTATSSHCGLACEMNEDWPA